MRKRLWSLWCTRRCVSVPLSARRQMKRMCGYSRVIANAFQRKWKCCVAFLCATILLETMTIVFGGYRISTDEDRPEHFLTQYEAYCARSLLPRGWYVMPGPSSEIVPIYGNRNESANFMWLPQPHRNLTDSDGRGAPVVSYGRGSSTPRMPSTDYGLCSCVPSELGECTWGIYRSGRNKEKISLVGRTSVTSNRVGINDGQTMDKPWTNDGQLMDKRLESWVYRL